MRGEHACGARADGAGVKTGVDRDPLDVLNVFVAGKRSKRFDCLVGSWCHCRDSGVCIGGDDEVYLAFPFLGDGFGCTVTEELAESFIGGAVAPYAFHRAVKRNCEERHSAFDRFFRICQCDLLACIAVDYYVALLCDHGVIRGSHAGAVSNYLVGHFDTCLIAGLFKALQDLFPEAGRCVGYNKSDLERRGLFRRAVVLGGSLGSCRGCRRLIALSAARHQGAEHHDRE